jgi:hypothetical protein
MDNINNKCDNIVDIIPIISYSNADLEKITIVKQIWSI